MEQLGLREAGSDAPRELRCNNPVSGAFTAWPHIVVEAATVITVWHRVKKFPDSLNLWNRLSRY